jgi:fructose-1,6-bisphosphatase-3
MATFERYFVKEKETHEEHKDPYYKLYENEEICNKILEEFGMDPEKSVIVNGHVPVKTKKGESPIKANGKLFIIDGGFSKAYQPTTGIAGYTLIYNSYGLKLVTLEPFESVEKAVREETDIRSDSRVVTHAVKRKHVSDTDQGRRIQADVERLEELLDAYRSGLIRERR